jgi:uncharacterized repeat protein (TIGR01451 family)
LKVPSRRQVDALFKNSAFLKLFTNFSPFSSKNTASLSSPMATPVITKTQSVANPVPAGSEVTYTITYTNTTGAALVGVSITDTFGAGFTATSATGPTGVTTPIPAAGIVGPGAVTFNPVTLAAGASATFTVTGIVTGAAGATVVDIVTDDATAATVTVSTVLGAASADLAIVVRDASCFGAFGGADLFNLSGVTSTSLASLFGFPGFLPGSNIFGGTTATVSDGGRRATFIATVTNNGPSAAANVQAAFRVKEGSIVGFRQLTGPAFNLPFSGAGYTTGSIGFGGLSGYGGARASCDPISFFGVAIASLAPGDEAVFEIVVSVCLPKKESCAVAHLTTIVFSPTTADPDLSNNQSSATVLLRREEKCVEKRCKDPKCGKVIRH